MVYFLGLLSFTLLGVASIEFLLIYKLCIENFTLVKIAKRLSIINRELEYKLNKLRENQP